MGKMVDLSIIIFRFRSSACRVRGVGAASGDMFGEVEALFYRYKTNGGFEYVADLMIGPRAAAQSRAKPHRLPLIPAIPDRSGCWSRSRNRRRP